MARPLHAAGQTLSAAESTQLLTLALARETALNHMVHVGHRPEAYDLTPATDALWQEARAAFETADAALRAHLDKLAAATKGRTR